MAKILLADDDATVRDMVRRALTAEGHEVHATQDGIEASEYLAVNAAAIDLLVTDVDMPQLDGVALAARAIAAKPMVSVVLMSGLPDQLERSQGLRARRVAVIAKPFTLEQLKIVVRSALD